VGAEEEYYYLLDGAAINLAAVKSNPNERWQRNTLGSTKLFGDLKVSDFAHPASKQAMFVRSASKSRTFYNLEITYAIHLVIVYIYFSSVQY